MKYLIPSVAIFLMTFMLSFYGSWVIQKGSDDFLSYTHQNIFQDAAMWVATPGDLIATLVMNPTDIPERNPDSWPIRWTSAPVSATFWTILFGILFLVFSFGIGKLKKTV